MPEEGHIEGGDRTEQMQLSPGSILGRIGGLRAPSALPWWAILLLITMITAAYFMFTSVTYKRALDFISNGVWVTLWVTGAAFTIALVLGLITGLGRVSKNPVFFNLSTLYVEVIRGIPLIVLIIYMAFVVTPLALRGINLLLLTINQLLAGTSIRLPEAIVTSHIGFAVRGMIGLAFGYGAYLAEVFRAGIESIPAVRWKPLDRWA